MLNAEVDGMDVPIMVVPAAQYNAGYDEATRGAKPGDPPIIRHRQFRMVWRREDGDYVVVDPSWEFAKNQEARLRCN